MNTIDLIEAADERALPLSVVIVTYNEEDRIRECIESVFAACRAVGEFEVILVNSNSADRTVEFATEYPITVLRIPSDDLTTPGAGRYVGTRVANGERILFVDGDMVMTETWLPRAIERLREEGVAAVDGCLNFPTGDGVVHEIDSVRGVALYDADALRSVGGFDPQLNALEDIHLGYQLVTEGYRLLRLPEVAAHHPSVALSDPLRRWRRGYLHAFGQVLRKSASSPRLLGKHLYRARHRLVIMAWLCLGAMTLVITPALVAWITLSILGFGVAVSRLGFFGAVRFSVSKVLGIPGLLFGLRDRPQSPESFPFDAIEVVAEGPVHDDLVSGCTDARK